MGNKGNTISQNNFRHLSLSSAANTEYRYFFIHTSWYYSPAKLWYSGTWLL